MTDTVLREFMQDIDELVLEPSSGGVFEVFKDGDKIYSKDETGEFPDEDDIINQLR